MFTCNVFIIVVVKKFDYVFAENGLVAFKNGELIEKQVITILLLVTIRL